MGCYVDQDDPARILTGAFFSPNAMTLESCANLCQNYQFFGVGYG